MFWIGLFAGFAWGCLFMIAGIAVFTYLTNDDDEGD